MIVREAIDFVRTGDPKKSLQLGIENHPWRLHDYLMELFRQKGYDTRESGRDFEKNDYYLVIFNIGVSTKGFTDEGNGLNFMRYKERKFHSKYGVDASNTPEGEEPIFMSNDLEECIDYIDQNIEKYS
jgi:hypothetical protein